jgi:hypothetical protein
MPEDKKSKLVQAIVDRVVNDVVVAVIRHPDATEDESDTFKEIYIPGERFKDFPNEGDIIPIDPDKPDVITVNIGNTLYCEVVFFMAHAENEYIIFKYEEKHTMSGLYNDADDINAFSPPAANSGKPPTTTSSVLKERIPINTSISQINLLDRQMPGQRTVHRLRPPDRLQRLRQQHPVRSRKIRLRTHPKQVLIKTATSFYSLPV